MSEFLTLPLDAVRVHPRHRDIFGEPSAQSMEALRASIATKGVVTPCVITSASAREHASCCVDGARRLLICGELGIREIPVIVDETLQSELAQVERMVHGAQRIHYTPRERAQQAEAFRAYLASLSESQRHERYGDKEPAAIVAMVISEPKHNIHRLRVVFGSASSTDELKSAVDSGRLPLAEAYKIILTAERRRAPGSENARRLVNALITRALEAREAKRRGKWRRAPRTPVFQPTPKPPSFLQETQRQIVEWALTETPAHLRNRSAYAPQVEAAVKDFLIELRTATAVFRARLRRLGRVGSRAPVSPLGDLPRLNESLATLNLPAVRRLDSVDLDEVRRTHRTLARTFHPDLNSTPGAREVFERMHGAYETVLEICDR